MRLLVLLSMTGLLGCVPPSPAPRYAVRHSVLVAPPTPVMRSGAPLDSKARVQLDNSTAMTTSAPEADNRGLYVTRHNIGGGLRVRTSEHSDLGLRISTGLLHGARAVSDDALAPPEGSVWNYGLSFSGSSPIDRGFHFGVAADLLISSSPVLEERRCVANCDGINRDGLVAERGLTPIGSLSLLPHYRSHSMVAFVGVTLRNHPTRAAEQMSTGSLEEDALEAGSLYFLVNGGVEFDVGDGVKLLGQIYQPIGSEIARHGPTLGVAISMDLGRHPATPRPPAAGER